MKHLKPARSDMASNVIVIRAKNHLPECRYCRHCIPQPFALICEVKNSFTHEGATCEEFERRLT